MKLPVTLWERLQYAGKWRIALVTVLGAGTGKLLWDSADFVYGTSWAGSRWIRAGRASTLPGCLLGSRGTADRQPAPPRPPADIATDRARAA
eukprot:CAMPEP_0197897580 /NCGR_PEP_ID=MMETSP1439-20131203/42263_1 /TAXON_ID=66791 /ORGANISM="Gonyaulax spinifera, Strain CCMP409" /LENGTH=91 /DNA_ID=CAMNT_0043518219 /DNA_START=87 /DNA_END=360 /DNA_ORIENTATION=-